MRCAWLAAAIHRPDHGCAFLCAIQPLLHLSNMLRPRLCANRPSCTCLHRREYEALADDFIKLGLLPPGSDRSVIVPALTGVFQQALAGGVSNLSFGDLSGGRCVSVCVLVCCCGVGVCEYVLCAVVLLLCPIVLLSVMREWAGHHSAV